MMEKIHRHSAVLRKFRRLACLVRKIKFKKGANQAIEMFKHGIFAEMRSAYIAKVVKYDKKKHIADVQPLANLSSGEESAQYLDIPVAESCYMLDEVMDRLKPEFAKVDSMKHSTSNIVGKYPKKEIYA